MLHVQYSIVYSLSSCKNEYLYPLNSNLPFPPPPNPWQPSFYFLLPRLTTLDTSYT